MSEQIHAILWLKWRLIKNRFSRTSLANRTGTFASIGIIGLLLLVVAGYVVCMGFFFGAWSIQGGNSRVFKLVGGVTLYLIGMEIISRMNPKSPLGEIIDVRKILYLPIRMRNLVALNLTTSFADSLLILFTLGITSYCAGRAMQNGPAMIFFGIPLVAAFVFMYAMWSSLVWIYLERLLQRTVFRAIFFIAFFGMTMYPMVSQFSHFEQFEAASDARNKVYSQNLSREHVYRALKAADSVKSEFRREVAAETYFAYAVAFPPLLLALGLASLSQGSTGTAAISFAAMLGLAVAAFPLNVEAYKTRTLGGPSKTPPKTRLRLGRALPRGAMFLDRFRIPGFSPAFQAAVNVGIVTRLRHVQIVQTYIVLMMLPLMFGAMAYFMPKDFLPDAKYAGAVYIGLVIMTAWICGSTHFNIFGHERSGLKSLLVLPQPLHRFMSAMSVAVFLEQAIASSTVMIAFLFLFRPGIGWGISGCLLWLQMQLLLMPAGSYVSILYPMQYSAKGADPFRNVSRMPMAITTSTAAMFACIAPATGVLVMCLVTLWMNPAYAVPVAACGSLIMLAASVIFFISTRLIIESVLEREKFNLIAKLSEGES
jgi:hypothetical protein